MLSTEAEVADFQHHVLLSVGFAADHQEVLRLEIAVDYAMRVQVLDAVEHLMN